ncbi:uncharacterized protein LOC125042977 [Penaeus chinensis]|uniref:uncharacterized protein LOC125042977 n=1 Tax=Penaeus chinensis TaxID=139456 RepID=UPI001FB6EEDA|nr:uncharacterized protein LOC125042977 [Penaeus chinensis]
MTYSDAQEKGADPLPMPVKRSDTAWNGYRFLVVMGVLASVVIYTMGAILTGIAYRTMDSRANCTRVGLDGPQAQTVISMHGFNTSLVVVGPCFMAAGGAIVAFIIFQWCFCRPVIRE